MGVGAAGWAPGGADTLGAKGRLACVLGKSPPACRVPCCCGARSSRANSTMIDKGWLARLLAQCDEDAPDAALLEAEVVPYYAETKGPRDGSTLVAQRTLAALQARDGERARAGALFAACAAGYEALYGAEPHHSGQAEP